MYRIQAYENKENRTPARGVVPASGQGSHHLKRGFNIIKENIIQNKL
jgi:hypothetical protein